MKNVYCDTVECIHRRGCKRWIDFQAGDYKKCVALIYPQNCFKECFKYLIRAKLSDGSTDK